MLKISMAASVVDSDYDANDGEISVYEGASNLGRVYRHPEINSLAVAVAGAFGSGFVIVDNPSAGSHTYKLRGSTTAGEFTFYGSVTITVDDVGPSM
jgi:hypothetical protein